MEGRMDGWTSGWIYCLAELTAIVVLKFHSTCVKKWVSESLDSQHVARGMSHMREEGLILDTEASMPVTR